MKVILNEEWWDDIKAMVKDEDDSEYGLGYKHRYTTGKGKMKIGIADWTDDSLKKLEAFLTAKANAGDRSAKLSLNTVHQWMEIKSNPNGQVVPKLENVEPAMKKYIGASANRYVFEMLPDGNFVPWFVHSIKYHEATENSPACVVVDLSAINTGMGSRRGRNGDGPECKTFSLCTADIRNCTMSQVIEAEGYYLETPARMESYQKEVATYLERCDEDGFQMSVTGKAKLINGWYDHSYRPVGQSGRPAKMVMDPPERERDGDSVHAPYWDKSEDKVWHLPIHPVYEMFDLDEHADYRVHVNNTEPYVYNDKVDQKLVLPEEVKDFLTVLIEHSKNHFEDIVGGKEGGTIVLIEGVPGIGKTLTAEVYSEKMHRPLYKVQSSQLGTEPKTVEDQLKEVLQRAERWGAILLIDEADVYVRERGIDIRQNAIVGVFLRVLEYYRGVLFMTTNIGHAVDDAIISRTTARFRYEMPSLNDQFKLWTVMSEQNKVDLSKDEIISVMEALPDLSGRDIKNLMKLAMVMAANKQTRVTPEIIKFVARFKQSGRDKSGVVQDNKVAKIGRE